MTPTIRIGLRFDRRDERALRLLADRAKHREISEAHNVFELAAEAASTGEPLIVICNNLIEAIVMAKGYGRWGIREPTLEQLTLTRANPRG